MDTFFMPELPEVHTILEDLKHAGLIGREILEAHVYWPKTIGQPDVMTFCQQIRNKHIKSLERRGKYLIFILSEGFFLFIHLRMTGRLLLVEQQRPMEPYIRLRLDFE